MAEPIVRSWGWQDNSGMAIRLTRRDELLTITITAPAGSLDLEAFLQVTEDGVSGCEPA